MAEEKTILVKKKDGTFARMKLSDLKKQPAPLPTPPQTAVPIKEKTETVWTKEDIKSPLEDEELKNMKHDFNKRKDEVEEIIKNLSFKLSGQAVVNLRNTLILFLKDIKNEEQISDLLRQPVYLGGADLTDKNLQELLVAAKEKITAIAKEAKEPIKPLKRVAPVKTVLPMKETEPLPASASPFNAFVHKPIFRKEVKEIKSLNELIEKDREELPVMSQLKKETVKPVVEDIVPPRNIVIGPVDEIKSFTITDFRRLSSDLEQAVSRLQQKFLNLKEESFLLYLEALDAWQRSPLYRDYLEKICMSLNTSVPLSNLPKKENELSLEEIKLLIKMEKEI